MVKSNLGTTEYGTKNACGRCIGLSRANFTGDMPCREEGPMTEVIIDTYQSTCPVDGENINQQRRASGSRSYIGDRDGIIYGRQRNHEVI